MFFRILTLYFSVIEGKNLCPQDKNGLSDPYIKIKLIPELMLEVTNHITKRSKSPSFGNRSLKTKIVKANLNPYWNEDLTMDLKPGDENCRLLIGNIHKLRQCKPIQVQIKNPNK